MKKINEIKKILEFNKSILINKYNLKSLAIFGSFSREEQTDKSDIDILVEFNKPIGIEFIDLAEELESILNIKVDLISKNGIKLRYFKAIEDELIYV